MAHYKRGKCYMMMHDYKRAMLDFCAAAFNEHKSAKSSINQQVRSEGGMALFHMCSGQCNFYLGQYQEALGCYENARKEDIDGALTGLIMYNKGLANASLMKYEEAIRDYEDSIAATQD